MSEAVNVTIELAEGVEISEVMQQIADHFGNLDHDYSHVVSFYDTSETQIGQLKITGRSTSPES
jgi:hypothetical protein